MAVETLSTLSLSTGSKTVVFSFRKAHRVNNRLLYCRRRLQQQQQQQQVVVKATSSTEGEQNTPSAKEEEDDGQDVFAETRRENVVVSPTASEEEGVEEEDKGDNNKKKLWECSQCFGNNDNNASATRVHQTLLFLSYPPFSYSLASYFISSLCSTTIARAGRICKREGDDQPHQRKRVHSNISRLIFYTAR